MQNEYEKTYALSFADQKSAAEALDAMQYKYRSPLYEWHAEGTCKPSKFIVVFPEGAKSLLSEELQIEAVECRYPFPAGCFIPVVYRFMEERYIDEFFDKGTLQLSTFRHCSKLEDPLRKDGKEGESIIVGVRDEISMESHMRMGNEVLLLCTSLASQYTDTKGEKCKCALEIFDVVGFVDACVNAILSKGYHIMNVQSGPCFYAEKRIYGELVEEEMKKMVKDGGMTLEDIFAIPQRLAGMKMLFQKPIEKAVEMEYRMVWLVYPEPQEETMLIQIEEPSKFARKIIL